MTIEELKEARQAACRIKDGFADTEGERKIADLWCSLIDAEINRQLIQPDDIRLAIEDLSKIPELLTDHLGYCDWHSIASAVNTAIAVLSDQTRARTIGQDLKKIVGWPQQMTIDRLEELHTLTGQFAKEAIDAGFDSTAMDFAADVRSLIDAEIARQSVEDESGIGGGA